MLITEVFDSFNQPVTPKPDNYEYPSFDKTKPTLARIWHIKNPIGPPVIKIGCVAKEQADWGDSFKSIEGKSGKIVINNYLKDSWGHITASQHAFSGAYGGKPLEHNIRILEYTNNTDELMQCMPVHQDFCVSTMALLEALIPHSAEAISEDHFLNVSASKQYYKGIFHPDFEAGQDSHAAYCPAQTTRIYAVHFVYPGKNYLNEFLPNSFYERDKLHHALFYDRELYENHVKGYSTMWEKWYNNELTFKDYYDWFIPTFARAT